MGKGQGGELQDIDNRYEEVNRLVERLYLGGSEKVDRLGLINNKGCLITSQ